MTARPIRVQLSRAKGWRMPANTVKVDRTTMWGNFAASRQGQSAGRLAVDSFKDWLENEASWAWKGRAVTELRGKNLACWCAIGAPCHADILLEIVNDVEVLEK